MVPTMRAVFKRENVLGLGCLPGHQETVMREPLKKENAMETGCLPGITAQPTPVLTKMGKNRVRVFFNPKKKSRYAMKYQNVTSKPGNKVN